MRSRFGVKGTGNRDQGSGNRKTAAAERECGAAGLSDCGMGARNSVFISPLQIAYSFFTEIGVLWNHGASSRETVCSAREAGGDGELNGFQCENNLADSRGIRDLVHALDALELVEGRAALRRPLTYHTKGACGNSVRRDPSPESSEKTRIAAEL
jgi:hypothetical protein